MSDKKWKQFEQLVAKIHANLSPEAKITLNDKILGKKTGKKEIDISIKQNIAQYDLLIAIDCKDYSKPLDVKAVEASMGLFDDIGANQGVIVAANGFSSTALKRGTKAGLKLYRLVDTGEHDWKTNVSIPAFCTLHRLKEYNLSISSTGRLILPGNVEDLVELTLYDDNGNVLGTPKQLIYDNWMMGKYPIEVGWQYDLKLTNKDNVTINFQNENFTVNILANINISHEMYFHDMPLSDISGFRDEADKKIITRSITTTPLSLEILQKEWQHLKSKEQLKVKPAFSVSLLA